MKLYLKINRWVKNIPMKDKNLGQQYQNKTLILINVVLLTFMACLDSSIVNVALPVMAQSFDLGMNSVSIVVSSYLITISAFILIFGRLGDIKGKVKIFKLGIIIFTLGSLFCALATNLWILVVARIIKAFGAAAFMATNQGIITMVYPPNQRGKALGVIGSFVAFGTLVGPPLGGVIVNSISWRYIFLINIPIGIFALIMGKCVLPKDVEFANDKFDFKGAALLLVSIVTLFGALLVGEQFGYTQYYVLIGFAIAIISFIAFIFAEKKAHTPLLELSLFKNKLFSVSLICAFIVFITISVSNIILPFYFQDALKLSPALSGMLLMASPLVLAAVSPLSGYLSDKIGSEILTFIGLSITCCGMLLMSTLSIKFSPIAIVGFLSVLSLGSGMFQSPNSSLIMSSVARNRLGIAGSINAFVRNLGMVVGISFSNIILYQTMSFKLGYSVSTFSNGMEETFVFAMKTVYLAAAGLTAVGAIITAARYFVYRKSKKEEMTQLTID